jgi:hypothetical protein
MVLVCGAGRQCGDDDAFVLHAGGIMIEYRCTYPGCRKIVESEEQPYCQHGQAKVAMRRVVNVPGSRYDIKRDKNTTPRSYQE